MWICFRYGLVVFFYMFPRTPFSRSEVHTFTGQWPSVHWLAVSYWHATRCASGFMDFYGGLGMRLGVAEVSWWKVKTLWNITQRRRVPINIGPSRSKQMQKAGCIGPASSCRDECGPPLSPTKYSFICTGVTSLFLLLRGSLIPELA